MYYKTILFTKAPLLKAYRYRNVFQLVPIFYSQTAPFSKYASHFPAFLEYVVDENAEEELDIVDTLRKCGIPENYILAGKSIPKQSQVRKEILHLLTSLTNFQFFEYEVDDNHWGIQAPVDIDILNSEEKKLLNNQTSHWTIRSYVYSDLKRDLQITGFTDCKSYYKGTGEIYPYFTNNPHLEENHEIKMPPYLDSTLDRYYSMNVEDRNWVRQYVALLNQGIDLFDSKRSVSLLSIISSIEGMAFLDYKKYGKTKGLGPKNRFLRFLRLYVSSNSEEKFKKYYEKRCEIAHEGVLFLSDIDLYANLTTQDEDWLFRLEVMQVARLALYNWLRREM